MVNFVRYGSIEDVGEQHWQALQQNSQLFSSYAFINALAETGCIGRDSGWEPAPLTIRENGNYQTLIPAYIKQHSYGEYVFDWSWAEAYQRYGLPYYPKLLIAAPFTPVPGPRIFGDQACLPELPAMLSSLCHDDGLSGWHLNFTDDVTAQIISDAGMGSVHRRTGVQFHWHNRDYQSFDHYLSHFVSRKRKAVLKERRSIVEQNIHLERLTGVQIEPQHIRYFFQCYANTYRQRRSVPYLNEAFFQKLASIMNDQMLLIMATYQGQPIAAALCFFDETTLYGRYWGATTDVSALHFEACYYQGIEFCIERGLQTFNPGTQGEHKIARGFEPVLTHSLHWLVHEGFNDAVGAFVAEETPQVLHYRDQAASLLPFHREG